jgi:hypothetical protein|tara:strand:- start:519 stop:1151 length:633 start_codon:yes stop_codon:yes gene_type:complete
MKITREKLKQIIKEELETALNEQTPAYYQAGKIGAGIPGIFKRLSPVPDYLVQSYKGKKKVYNTNNGNIVALDDRGIPFVSYADEMEKNPNADYQFAIDTLKKNGYVEASLSVPMSPANLDALTLGTIKGEEVDRGYVQRARANFMNQDKDIPRIKQVIGKRELSDPSMPNWDPSKNQIVYLGSRTLSSGGREIYFKTSNTHKYYKALAR